MPSIVFDCSEDVLQMQKGEEILNKMHGTVLATELFDEKAIKIRINPYSCYLTGGNWEPFIQISATIMPGRTDEQLGQLSRAVVSMLAEMFPEVKQITMGIEEFNKPGYCNRRMIM